MGFWEFMTVAVVFSSVFGYLKSLKKVAEQKRLDALEARVLELEKLKTVDELAQRVDVIEQIVVADDVGLQRRIDAADAVARAAAVQAAPQFVREPQPEEA